MESEEKSARSVLSIYEGMAFFYGESLDINSHSHHFIQIFVSVADEFTIALEDREETASMFIINSDIPHKIENSKSPLIMIFLEPEFEISHYLIHNLELQARGLFYQHKSEWERKNNINYNDYLHDPDRVRIEELIFIILMNIAGSGIPEAEFWRKFRQRSFAEDRCYDDRIIKVIREIRSRLSRDSQEGLMAYEMAAIAALSEGRFLHLFRESLGLPFRKYIIWEKLQLAVRNVASGMDLTEAAHNSGFSDSSHFNRSFKSMFGITPALIFKKRKDSQFVQVLT